MTSDRRSPTSILDCIGGMPLVPLTRIAGRLFGGGSAGTAVVAAMRVAARTDLDGPVVVLLPDGWDRYHSKGWMQSDMAPVDQPPVVNRPRAGGK